MYFLILSRVPRVNRVHRKKEIIKKLTPYYILQMDIKEASTVKLDQLKGAGWVVMYPSYIDKEMSVKDGRRVTKDVACTWV